MNNNERYEYFNSGQLQRSVQMELLDWAGYWTTAGLDEITDPLQRQQTRVAINMILIDQGGGMVAKVSRLAISADVFKTKSASAVTDEDIRAVVVSIMANKLEWLTGVTSLPPEPDPEE